jgi:hypothetical protein
MHINKPKYLRVLLSIQNNLKQYLKNIIHKFLEEKMQKIILLALFAVFAVAFGQKPKPCSTPPVSQFY